MRFWKIFAWIALGWALVARRGAGILVRKTSSNRPKDETEKPEQQSGPGWRRASPSSTGYPGRPAQARTEPTDDSVADT